jgi:hypothetical protein
MSKMLFSKNGLWTGSTKPSLQHFQFCRVGLSLGILYLSILGFQGFSKELSHELYFLLGLMLQKHCLHILMTHCCVKYFTYNKENIKNIRQLWCWDCIQVFVINKVYFVVKLFCGNVAEVIYKRNEHLHDMELSKLLKLVAVYQ